jgi:hypothetical protein
MEQPSTSLLDLQIDQPCAAYLLEAAKWNRFLAIVWFVLCGLMAIFSFFAGSMIADIYGNMPGMGDSMQMMAGGGGIIVTIFYLLMTAVCLIPNFWRYRFSVQAIAAVRSNDQVQLNLSLNNFRKYSKYWGILTIIIIALYLLIFVFAIIGGVMMMGR